MELLVDVANVLGSRADGWWRDRAGATTRLLAQIAGLRGRTATVPAGDDDDVTVTLDGITVVLESGHRYTVRIEERQLPGPRPSIADDRVPAGWRLPKDRTHPFKPR